MEGALSRLLVVVERYPELKSNENFLKLQDQLEGTENRIRILVKKFVEEKIFKEIHILQKFPLSEEQKKETAAYPSVYVHTIEKKNSFFTTFYSGFDSHVLLSQQAQKNCKNLAVLVSPSTRSTFYTLKKLGLIITTTDWWGDHPSMVYYFQRPLTFFYYPDEFAKSLPQFQCASIYNDDVQLLREQPFSKIDSYTNMILYKHD